MSALASALETSVVAGLASWTGAIAQELAASCLVESDAGKLLAHAVVAENPPASVVDAIIHSDLRRLERAVQRNRTVGLTSAGPVIVGDLVDDRGVVAQIGLRLGDLRVGSMCLVLAGRTVPAMKELDHLGCEAARLLTSHQLEVPEVVRVLDGDLSALPIVLRDYPQLCVVAADGLSTGSMVELSEHVIVGRVGTRGYAVLGATDSLVPEEVARRVGPLLGRRPTARAAVSDVHDASRIVAAREQVDVVLAVTPEGACATPTTSRERVVMGHLVQAFDTLPPLGRDPLVALHDYDARRDGRLVKSLQAWLSTDCDLRRAARDLSVHPNTLRYRINRAAEVAQIDLEGDLALRFELWLRLVAR